MTLLFADGFDAHNTNTNGTEGAVLRWTAASGNLDSLVTGGRYGGGKVEMSFGSEHLAFSHSSSENTFGVGMAFELDLSANIPTPTELIVFLKGGNKQCELYFTNEQEFIIERNGTILARTPPGILSFWGYNHIEFKVTCRTGSNGSASIRVNGVEVLSIVNTNTAGGGSDGCDEFRIVGAAGNSNTDHEFEDVVFWDSAGSVNNDFLGDLRIETLYPTADTSDADWAPLSAGDNFVEVDEANQDGDTSYNASSTDAHKDLFTTGNMVGTSELIHAVQIVALAKMSEAGTDNLKVMVKSGSTESSVTRALTTGYRHLLHLMELDPNTSLAWTQAGVDAMLIGYEQDLGSVDTRVSQVVAEVIYRSNTPIRVSGVHLELLFQNNE